MTVFPAKGRPNIVFNWKYLLCLAGYFSLGLGASQSVSLLWAVTTLDAGILPLFLSSLVVTCLGLLAVRAFRTPGEHELTDREALLFVASVWFLAGALGGLPFWFSGQFGGFTDAMFESVSGFTTTGASILSDVEALPGSLLFWRAFTHWLGGLGIIILMVAVLPLIGPGGMALYRAEFSGASSEKIKPRVAETAASLWQVYIGYTIVGIVALRTAGMNTLDSFCHTFAALGTGGFSTRNGSVEAFNSTSVEIILILLMVAGGLNFTQHYRLLVSHHFRAVSRDTEIRFYLGALLTATILIATSLWVAGPVSPARALRLASFQTVSIMTATGFSSADFAVWNPFSQFLLLTLMWVGGSTGSTAGGIKCARMALLGKQVGAQLRLLGRPRTVVSFRFSGQKPAEKTVEAALKIVYLAVIVNAASSLLLTATGMDVLSAISAVTSAMFNVGPGLGTVGPAEHYGHLHTFAKWVLILTMIAGRLEFFGFLVVFTPDFWRR